MKINKIYRLDLFKKNILSIFFNDNLIFYQALMKGQEMTACLLVQICKVN